MCCRDSGELEKRVVEKRWRRVSILKHRQSDKSVVEQCCREARGLALQNTCL